jgi:hypothetical protein
MPTVTITLPRQHEGQQIITREARRFNALACGRRFGKTTYGIDRCVTPDVLPYPVGWFSPTYKMLLEVWREAVRVLKPIANRVSTADHRIENMAGGVLEFWSLDNPDSARGRKYRRIIVDEAAMVPALMDAWQYVLRPTLVDYSGDAWFLSTPKGRNGFWQMWQWGIDPLQPEWASWQMPSSVNPRIPASELEAMRSTMPERVYQQEIEARFLEDGGSIFRGITEAATAEQQAGPRSGSTYVAGLDWALSHDFTVLTIVDATAQAVAYVDRFNGVDYSLQRQRIKAACERFGVTSVIAEENAMGKPNNDELRRMGLPVRDFTTTNTSKAEIVEKLAAGFEQGNVKIINDPMLIAELQAFGAERLPGGMTRYSAPDNMHDDMVISLALAWYAAVKPRRQPSTMRG